MNLRFCAIALLGATAVHAASFDCGKARTFTEKTICSDPKLSTADEEMAGLYTAALGGAGPRPLLNAQELKQDQVAWVTLIQSQCKSALCLAAAYRDRIRLLKNIGNTVDAPVPAGIKTGDRTLGDMGDFPQIQSPVYHPGVELYNSLVRRLVADMRRQNGASKVDFIFDLSIVGGRVASSYAKMSLALGGAHPMPARAVINVDLNSAKEIALGDLFTPGSNYMDL